MKTDILKALRRLRLPALALAAFLASCTSELAHEPAPGGGSQAGEALVTLRLQVPGAAAAGKTRAVGDNAERTVNDLYILAFKVDGGVETFDYYAVARKGTEDLTTGVSKWTASLRPKDYEQTFVMIANAQGTPGDVNTQIAALVDDGAGGTSVGEDKETVLEKLTDKLTADEQTAGFNAKGDNDHHPFTMYGQTAATKIELGKDVSLTVALHRIVARVNMAFTGDATTNFTASKVYLCNFTDRARVIPNGLGQTTGTDYEPAATIPADAQKLPAAFDVLGNIPTYTVTANEVKNQIYLFETNQPAPDDADAHLKRPCLVVQGTYEGYEGYYRVDFATQDATTGDVTYRDIIRNHSYNFTVTNVSGRGSATLQEAMETKASNLTADMILWDDNVIGNIDFEGDRVLGIGTNSYELIKSGGIKLLQVRATTNVTWTANIYAAKPDGSADTQGTRPAWISFTNADGNMQGDGKTLADQAGVDALQDVYFKVEVNDERPERQAVIRLTDERGRLSVEAVVTQNQTSIPVFLNVKQLGVPVTEMDFGQNGETPLTHLDIEFGPADVKLTWEIKEDPDAGRMDVTETSTNAGANYTTDMKGEVTSVGDTHQLQFRGKATNVADDPDVPYETRTATLTLIAQHTTSGEIVVQNIRLFQKKLGLVIDRTEVLCGGQEALIYVKGNVSWVASLSGQGFTEAVNAGLLLNSSSVGSGKPSETVWSDESCIRIKTYAKPRNRNNYAASLEFKQSSSSASITSIPITIRGGVLAIEKWENYLKVTEVYDVYGPVDRSLNTKDVPYTDTGSGTEIQEAKMMTYEQGYALTQVDPGMVWEICKDSELVHEFFITSIGKEVHSTGGYKDFKADVPGYWANDASIIERVKMTYAGSDKAKELDKQDLLSIQSANGHESVTHFLLTGTNANVNSANLTFTIDQLGRLVDNKFGVPEFSPIYQNVKWLHESGEVAGSMPTNVYGTRWEASFVGHQVGYKKVKVKVTRRGVTTPLETEQHKGTEYPTYYFKLIN